MSKFIIDDFPVLRVPRGTALSVIERVVSLYPPELACLNKMSGPDNYMCRSLAPISRKVREDFEAIEWGESLEFAGVALDFVGMALKAASKYLMTIRPANLDCEMILANIEAREDIVIDE